MIEQHLMIALLAWTAVLGATLGSFACVVAGRGWAGSVRGRSRCDGCGRELRWFELFPLLSYAWLRGRCRRCGARIGAAALVWEAGGAVVGMLSTLAVALILSAR